ncbi:unnamed protein product [Cuscuta campestris]|uniref:Uncharacterized protein n=1 Tax=Cuscuta campestris TaxID=132261 RepID=A0A484KNL1_9ASTE|nr:unnamed protein product [Cuscuta campestris]
MMEDVTTLPNPTMEDIDESKESSVRSHNKEGDYNRSGIIGDDGGALDEDYGYEVLASIEKVADADKKQVDNLISFDDTIKLFDLVDVVETEYLVSPRATANSMCRVSYDHHFAAKAWIFEDSKHGLLLWFSFISPVQHHEWEPPP